MSQISSSLRGFLDNMTSHDDHQSNAMSASDYVQITDTLKSTFSAEIPKINHAQFICEKLARNSHRTVLVDGPSSRAWTGHEMNQAILKLSSQLVQKYGLKHGDRVSFHCRNSDYHAIALYAIIAAGGVYTGCGHLHPYREMFNTVFDAKVTFLVVEKDNISLADKIRKDFPKVRHVLTVLDEVSGVDSLEALLQVPSDTIVDHEFARIDSTDDMAVIHFSSGTTGKPKPAIRTHGNFNSVVLFDDPHPGHWFPRSRDDVVACSVPFVHGGGFSMLLFSLAIGSKAIAIPSFDTAVEFCEYSQKYQVIFLNNFNEADKYDLTSMQDIMVTGSIADPNLSRRFIAKYQPKQYRQLYGSTEMFWVTLLPNHLAREPFDLRSNGLPLPGVEIKIINPVTGQSLGPEQSGEVTVRGSWVTPGYLDNPEANAASFTEDGFFRTGDCGRFDTSGQLYIEDRFKEMIKSEGKVVSPTELEAVLLEHEAIAEATVIGFPHDLYGEAPRAFIVLNKGCKLSADDLIEYVAGQVAEFKCLRSGVRFLEKMPRTVLGKVDKKVLRIIP